MNGALAATQAAIRASYSKKTVGRMGTENLSKPVIAATIARARDLQADALDDDIADVVAHYARARPAGWGGDRWQAIGTVRTRDRQAERHATDIVAQYARARQEQADSYADDEEIDHKHSGSLTIGIRRNERVDGE